jgi:hypothetical protein
MTLIIALVLAVIALVALIAAVVTTNEVIAWVCIGASVLGVLLLVVDAIRERQNARVGAVAAGAGAAELDSEAEDAAVADSEAADVLVVDRDAEDGVDDIYADDPSDYSDYSIEDSTEAEISAEDISAEVAAEDISAEISAEDISAEISAEDDFSAEIAREDFPAEVVHDEPEYDTISDDEIEYPAPADETVIVYRPAEETADDTLIVLTGDTGDERDDR